MGRFNKKFTRRQALAGFGVTAAVAPFIPMLESGAGGPETPPQRFISLFHPHGTIRPNWLPSGTSTNFTLGPILQPLAPFQDQLVVIDGLSVYPAGPPGGAHTVGPAYVYTGSPMLADGEFMHPTAGGPHGWASHASVDQVIADAVGTKTPFKSLEFGVQTGGNHPGSRISYAGANMPLAPQRDPEAMFEILFGEFGVDLETQAKIKAERLSIIDLVKPELDEVRPKVNIADRGKIDAHLDGIRSLENRLQAEYVCTPPDIGPPVNLGDFNETRTISRKQIDILVEAFACGVTNVASIMYRVGENDANPYPFLGFSEDHHSQSHLPDSDPVGQANLTSIYTFFAEEIAYLCQELDARMETDGSTILENTLMFWGSEIAKGNNHIWDDMPFVLLGGAQGAVQGNRFHTFAGNNHCQLLVACCQAMGLNINEFGGFDDQSGVLPGILS